MSITKMMVGLLGIASVAGLTMIGTAQTPNQAVADEVIAITKAQWAAEIKTPANIADQMKNIADDYTEFNGDFATRLEGKSLSMRLGEASAGGTVKPVASEMANPKVQVYNDVAILSYNFVGYTKDKDGKVEPTLAKSTRVYVRQGGKWMLVHANFAPDPLPK